MVTVGSALNAGRVRGAWKANACCGNEGVDGVCSSDSCNDSSWSDSSCCDGGGVADSGHSGQSTGVVAATGVGGRSGSKGGKGGADQSRRVVLEGGER